MKAKRILNLLRKHGTEPVVAAMLSPKRTKQGPELLKKQSLFLSRLTHTLEKKKVLRRGNVVDLICAAEEEPSNEITDEQG